MQSECRVRQYREECDNPGAGQHGERLRQIDQQQRGDGDDRGHLQDDGVGIKRILKKPRLVEQKRKSNAAEGR
jgi:hypothetical protein